MFLKDRINAVFRLAAVVSTWLFLAPTDAIAQSDNPSFYDLSRQSTEVGWLPGEQYDPRTGQLNHVMTDLNLTGNGLPITITRQVIQGGSHGIDIRFPKITIHGSSNTYLTRKCGEGSRVTYTDAYTKQHFVERNGANSNLNHYPSNARYISRDEWIIKCDSSRNHIVVSPDGIHYKFGYSLAGEDQDDVQHVSSVYDVHGNRLTYKYKDYKPPFENSHNEAIPGSIVGVSSITASDGRKVTIEYAKRGQIIPGKYTSSSEYYVKDIYSNGSPNKHQITYSFTSDGYKVFHGGSALNKTYEYKFARLSSMNTNLLSSVTYPAGGKVTYSYPTGNTLSIHTNYRALGHYPLQSRRVSGTDIENGTTTFEGVPDLSSSHDLYARLIKTPSSTIEYRYRKSDFSRVLNIDQGKLLKIKVFPTSQSYRSEYSNALIEKDFEYKVVNEFLPGSTNRVYHAVELVKEKTKLNYANSLSLVLTDNPLEFKIEYTYDNHYGSNPEFRMRTKKEYSPSGSVRETNYTYQTLATNNVWITGLLGSAVTSANDRTNYVYFSNGNVQSETHNGITTSYTYSGRNMTSRTTDGETYKYQDYYRGIPRTEIDESGRTKTRFVNSDGTLGNETDFGRSSKYGYTYDSIHRLTKTTYPDWARGETNYIYKSQNETYVTNSGSDAASTTTRYDGFGRTIIVKRVNYLSGTPRSIRITANQYDSEGRMTKMIYPTNENINDYQSLIALPGINYEYDGVGRKIKETEVLHLKNNTERTRQWLYLNSGKYERIQYTDSRNAKTDNYFMSYGTPKQEFLVMNVDGNRVRTDYGRDTSGRLTHITRDGKKREYRYNWRKELRSEEHPETGITTYTYHNDGQLKERINNGRKAIYHYYPDNQIREVIWDDGRSTIALKNYYNNQGLLESSERVVGDSNLSVFSSYGYDVLGRVIYENNTDNADVSLQMSYEYDSRGNLSSMTYPNGNRYALAPNAFGEITEIKELGGKTIVKDVWHHPNGAYSRIDSGNNSLRSGRDHLFQTRNRRHYKDNNKDTHYVYSYNSESSMSYLKNYMTGKHQRMYYDNGNRLTKVDGSRLGTRLFSYNSRDDIISKVDNGVNYKYDYDWRGQLTAITSKYPKRQFSYNPQGEVTKLHTYRNNAPNSLRQLTLTRDPEGRLVGTSDGTSDGTKYGYDSRGLRFFKEKNGRIYSYYDLGGKLRYRLDRSAGVETEYHYIGNELIAKREISIGADDPDPGSGQPPENDDFGDYYAIDHDNLRISWLHSDWHQVQKENGENLDPKCDGGSYCVVPEPGRYKFSRHGGNNPDDTIVTIGSTSAIRNFGNYTVNNSTKTISWSISGWHQVQNDKGEPLNPACDGGNSCSVSSDGEYIVINHAKDHKDPEHRTTVTVGQ